ncbi:MAG: GAF and ANTAR domain-containing protein [Actinomycetota bacterium]|nr:GAF and ANTAR domain-containing protein [Actinomycetota bacterium]MDQ2957263.1 GAF and ANTAR domain-containing protein [Actinomycetota bacterium]
MPYRDLTADFVTTARLLASRPTLASTLEGIVTYAVQNIDEAEHASITVRRANSGYRTLAATGELALQVDNIQYEANEGPCVDALREHHVFRSDDLATDDRWPIFGARATKLTDVVSMMSHRLFLEEDDALGSLNLYSRERAAFASLSLDTLNSLATLSAIAFAKASAEHDSQNLRQALETNRTIGMALGILMITYKIPRDEAFDMLRVVSQRTHRKLNDIATELADTGELTLRP